LDFDYEFHYVGKWRAMAVDAMSFPRRSDKQGRAGKKWIAR
jgi:hypothetical protein